MVTNKRLSAIFDGSSSKPLDELRSIVTRDPVIGVPVKSAMESDE
jgi:phosphoribosylcarboxyaminoimidazole (NCAIR) mutase